KNRFKPNQWLEFHNEIGAIYTVVYSYLGGYVLRFGEKEISNNYLSLIDNFKWYPKFKENLKVSKIESNLFSLSEIVQIIVDISRVNKLNLYQ
ncbi:MAG: hypothetical protein EB127_16870, partial [Alphaproteobacteria bacterium]|nr:hypothetical protein [Alphaproteobacteria bacterium]